MSDNLDNLNLFNHNSSDWSIPAHSTDGLN